MKAPLARGVVRICFGCRVSGEKQALELNIFTVEAELSQQKLRQARQSPQGIMEIYGQGALTMLGTIFAGKN